MEIIVYGKDKCKPCRMVCDWLTDKGFTYAYVDCTLNSLEYKIYPHIVIIMDNATITLTGYREKDLRTALNI